MIEVYSKDFLKKYPYYDDNLSIDERVSLILNRLTLREKFKLLSARRFSLWVTTPIRRLKIKSMGMSDGPNGISFHSSFRKNTRFPATIGLAASFNRELSKNFGTAIAKEIRKVGRHILLAPGINIDRTPLNGRTFEYFSEDPYLTTEMALPIVEGAQEQRIGACLKHYVANNQETNRFKVSSEVDERTLNEIYLKSFKEIVEKADPWSVMGCYNRINGIYGCEHKELLKKTLMDKWGFTGYVVSDWWATKFLDKPENCIKAGLSLEMPRAYAYKISRLKKSYNAGKFSEEELNSVVKRLLRVMILVGLFDHPSKVPKGERNTLEHQIISREIAEESMVLLKNENEILPLDSNKINSIAVYGPNAKKKLGKIIYGGSSAVVPPYEITPYQGLLERFQNKLTFTRNAKEADVCLIFVGLNHDKFQDCENFDRKDMKLPKNQVKLIKKIASQNPNTVVVLISGSPVEMSDWIEEVPAILEAWYPGQESGRAITRVLFGDVNPSGKLPITFPKKLNDSPAHKSKKTFPGDDKVFYEEGIFVGYRHFDKKNIEPLFPFGFGLSYTNFKFDKFILSSNKMKNDETIEISIEIENTGNYDGAEVVQMYIRDIKSKLPRPPKELRGFEKVHLKKNEKKKIEFTISLDDLKYYDPEVHGWIYEPGEFEILIGTSSRDIHFKEKFELI